MKRLNKSFIGKLFFSLIIFLVIVFIGILVFQKIIFQKTLTLQNITFDIINTGEGSISELTIQPKGLEIDNQKITIELDGQVVNAEIEDLNSSFVQDEIFGPFIVIERFNSSDEAIERANATRFGLAASVWGENREHARKLASKLKSGTVWLNCHNRLFAEAETGGYRESGYGRLHGLQGLEDFMSTKHVYWEDH